MSYASQIRSANAVRLAPVADFLQSSRWIPSCRLCGTSSRLQLAMAILITTKGLQFQVQLAVLDILNRQTIQYDQSLGSELL
jgi:hypothetical protein